MSASKDPSPTTGTLHGHRFQFRCLRCGSVLEARSSQSGRQARCPTCDASFAVPIIDAQTGLAASDADPGDDGELPTPMHAYAASGDKAPRIIRKDDDTLAIGCSRCDCENAVDADRCTRCGLPFTLEGAYAIAPSNRLGRTILLLVVAAVLLFLVIILLSPVYR